MMALWKWAQRAFWLSSSIAVLVMGAYLQEWAPRGIPAQARELNLTYPLAEPHIEIVVGRGALELWDGETLVRRYEAAFGKSPVAGRIGKAYQSTPTGEFKIIEKAMRRGPLDHGSRFMLLDFPNRDNARAARNCGAIDDAAFRRILDAHDLGRAPPADTDLGGALGIQGNYFFFRDRHFTDGSVALSNADVNELYDAVPVGTPVTIRDS